MIHPRPQTLELPEIAYFLQPETPKDNARTFRSLKRKQPAQFSEHHKISHFIQMNYLNQRLCP